MQPGCADCSSHAVARHSGGGCWVGTEGVIRHRTCCRCANDVEYQFWLTQCSVSTWYCMLFVCCCSVERRSKIDGVDVAWARWTYRSVLWKTGSGEPYAINRSKSTWSYRGRCTVTNFTGLDLKFWHGVVHALIDTLAAGPFSFFSREIWPIRRAKKYKSDQSQLKKKKQRGQAASIFARAVRIRG